MQLSQKQTLLGNVPGKVDRPLQRGPCKLCRVSVKAMPNQRQAPIEDTFSPGPAFAALAVSALLLMPQPSLAAMELPNKEADNDSPYIAELKRRSEEKREERAKQRLEDYYKRNYKDYFEFIGPGRSENNKAIAEWLKTNK